MCFSRIGRELLLFVSKQVELGQIVIQYLLRLLNYKLNPDVFVSPQVVPKTFAQQDGN